MLRFLLTAAVLGVGVSAQDEAEPLRVCATTPNIGAIARAVIGDEPVELTVLAKPPQDPHYVIARPSYVRVLHDADLLALVGLELEIGWLPALIDQARNVRIRPGMPGYQNAPGAAGYFDASTVISPLGVPMRDIDRSEGDLHARGNPHYLLDPVRGAEVADALAKRLGDLRIGSREAFQKNADELRARLGALMVGAELAQRYDFTKLAALHRHDRLIAFLKSQDQEELFGGVLKRAQQHRGTKVIADHDGWPYVTDRLGLIMVGFLEPRPGIPPSTRHLSDLIERAKAEDVRALLAVPYFDQQQIGFVAENSGIEAVTLAHQAGALPGTDDYASLCEYNFDAILDALDRATER
jgi:ABC-type Zn uptake system ZnuABC Zn-binding protein ZnuA